MESGSSSFQTCTAPVVSGMARRASAAGAHASTPTSAQTSAFLATRARLATAVRGLPAHPVGRAAAMDVAPAADAQARIVLADVAVADQAGVDHRPARDAEHARHCSEAE